jgi:hypothetical protein
MKTIQLYLFKDYDGDDVVSTMMPTPDGSGRMCRNDSDREIGTALCDAGVRQVFGLKSLESGHVYRVSLTVNEIEQGEYKVEAKFTPFAPVGHEPRKTRKKAQ